MKDSALLWCCLWLVVLQIIATFCVSDIYLHSDSASVKRIPIAFRGWPEYLTRSDIQGNHKNVVIIGNSNSNTRELPESLIYPALLQDKLDANHLNSIVHNWSMDGLKQEHLIFLYRHALERSVDVLLVVTSIFNFSPDPETAFKKHPADLDLLIARDPSQDMEDLKQQPYWDRIDKVMWSNLQLTSSLIRSRTLFLDWLAGVVPPHFDQIVFGRTYPRQGTRIQPEMDWAVIQQLKGVAGNSPANNNISTQNDQVAAAFEKQLLSLVDRAENKFTSTLASVLDRINLTNLPRLPKVIWIWEPIIPSATGAASERLNALAETGCDLVHSTDMQCLNMVNAFGVDQFFNFLISDHFNEVGHARMANEIYQVIHSELH